MTKKDAMKKSYEEMLTAAQAIHPDMKLRVSGDNKDEWALREKWGY